MKLHFSVACLSVLLGLCPSTSQADDALPASTEAKAAKLSSRQAERWEKLAPHFSPPAEFAGNTGTYRLPVCDRAGLAFTSPQAWRERQAELRQEWHTLLGAWPPVQRNPLVKLLKQERREALTQLTIEFDIMPGESNRAYLLVPDSAANQQHSAPAVVVVYYEPETAIGLGKPLRDYALELARRGFVTLSVGHDYSIYFPNREEATIQPLSALACGAANAFHVLAERPEVDPSRIGIVGHSYGGKWALFAAALYDKFACVAVSDPGIVFDEARESINYWEPWYLGYEGPKFRPRGLITPENPRTGLYKRLIDEGRDLHEIHSLLAPRPFLVSGGSEDFPSRWTPLNHLINANRLLGYEQRVGMTNRPGHDPTAEANSVVYAFFEYFLDGGQ